LLSAYKEEKMQKETKKTPLHAWHVSQGANMANFGGYEMPLWYPAGVKNEHLAVLTHAGLFDTSHMAVVMVVGRDAFELLQLCHSKDLNACVGINKKPIEPGKCVYGVYLKENGEVIDDAIVYQIAPDSYMVVINAGMGDEIAKHMLAHKDDRDVEITDLTDKVGKIDVQGPASAKILMKVLKAPEKVFEKMPYFSFKGHFDKNSPLSGAVCLTDETPILLSRTGYTGEFGFEIFVDPIHLMKLWEIILKVGSDFELMPCGLAARDSLRAGAVLPLSHQDIGDWPFINHPWPFALPYNDDQTDFTKDFIGGHALMKIQGAEYTYAFLGNDVRKVSTEDPAVALDAEGEEIGRVLTCATDMGIGRHGDRVYSITSPGKPKDFSPRGLCCGFVKVKSKLTTGQTIELKDNRRKIKVTIVDDIRPDRTARRPIKQML
jgi:aminomethyltransferase